MISRMTVVSLALAALLPLSAQAQHAQHAKHEWTYAGATGPAKWGAIKSDYVTCKTGHQQSPIDIHTRTTTKADLDPIVFEYQPSPLKIIDNGHTVQVNYAPGSGMAIGGVRHELLQFHFHTPSEERINGKQYPLGLHLVHRNADNKLAVVALLFKLGKENPALTNIFNNLPKEADVEQTVEGVTIDTMQILPPTQGYYNFPGSLTTPPCSEEANWFVLKTPVDMSKAQLAQFHKLYKHNARPVQHLNGRVVKESK
ncbi:carbonic anhydrase family protein [Massilia sp. CCM 9210]|uniref:carbonic anhydrase n=1 Tax=Massilia scottii TaxID=3057166 RepID=UPI002796D0BC|nr:carbonic anhydrase family protein [Massilia sp. CCM 9210]MDQ1812839.1 carbonic anhydrase family protein [Massilia sp. CCM 9210]